MVFAAMSGGVGLGLRHGQPNSGLAVLASEPACFFPP